MRTVHSVINTSPKSLLAEILLVDDASTRKFLGSELDDYVTNLTEKTSIPIHVHRAPERVGLIQARLIGARVAKGEILTFLDAHCEATVGWLEPLLDRIVENRKRVVCPIIDIISDETFGFSRSFELHWGGINWALNFRWYPISVNELKRSRKNGDESPFKTPIMAGGLFSIDRRYFFRLGSYDDQMDIWGGENIELSLRIWLCGGQLEIIPCSHVAHLFRKASPYSFPRHNGVNGVLYTNLARVVRVWLDRDYQNFFFMLNSAARRAIFDMVPVELDQLDRFSRINERIELRERLKCKDFRWFLDHIWREHFFPTEKRFFGRLRSKKLGHCLQKPSSGAAGSSNSAGIGRAEFDQCTIEPIASQLFIHSEDGFLMTDESICFDLINADTNPKVLLLACSQSVRQKWIYDNNLKRLKHEASSLCLGVGAGRKLIADKCDQFNIGQIWNLEPVEWREKKKSG